MSGRRRLVERHAPGHPAAPRVLALVLAAVACHVGGCHPDRPPLHPENPPGSWYVVRQGETLADVARKTGTPLDDILELNGIPRGEKVEGGRLIYVLDAGALHGPGGAGVGRTGAGAAGGGRDPDPDPASRSPGDRPGAGAGERSLAATFRWPLVSPRITSPFGVRGARPHEGIDLGAPEGTPVYAAGIGDVIFAGDGIRGYGNLIVVQHSGGLLTVYAHNSKILVKVGDRVGAGQSIALVGRTGHATAPHLHFEVRDGQIPRNPERYLPPIPGGP